MRQLALPVTESDFETGGYLLETALKGRHGQRGTFRISTPTAASSSQQRYEALTKKRST